MYSVYIILHTIIMFCGIIYKFIILKVKFTAWNVFNILIL